MALTLADGGTDRGTDRGTDGGNDRGTDGGTDRGTDGGTGSGNNRWWLDTVTDWMSERENVAMRTR